MEYMESQMQERFEASENDYEHYQILQSTVRELMELRKGKLPTLGYIADTDKSREIIGRLAELVGIEK
jgi:hypothetical protein